MSTPSSPPLPPAAFWQHATVFAKRFATLIVLCLAIYVAVGSCLFGGWWYGFFWDGQFAHFRWVEFGLRLLVSGYPLIVALAVVCGLLLFSVVMLAPRRLFAIIDRFTRPIIVGSVVTIVIAALVVYLTPSNLVDYGQLFPAMNASLATFDAQLEARLEEPGIDAPVYFHYLNTDAVDTLYNELKPELEETSRDIKSAADLKGGVEVGAGGSKVSIEGKKSEEEESKYNRPGFLPARQCLEVMKYVRKTWPTNYYSDYDDWWSRYTTPRVLHAGEGGLEVYDP